MAGAVRNGAADAMAVCVIARKTLVGRLRGAPQSAARLFLVYAAMSLVVVVGIGLALASSYRGEATRRGIAEGVSESQIIATTAIEPL